MIANISFIIIARNEAFAIEKCLESLAVMSIRDCEVICVDSDSTDDTQKIMTAYGDRIENLRVFQCSGLINAAVARNVGMRFATKKLIFFVDGDIELYSDFITKALDRIRSGRVDAVTGKLMEVQYTSDYKKEIRRLVRRKHMTKEEKCLMTGGIFIVTREILKKVGAWDESFVRLQDFEYTLRISRQGTLLQLPEFIGIHHSQEFHDRSWEHFKKSFPVFYGRLLRKNLDRPAFTIRLLRGNRGLATFLLLSFVALCSLISSLMFSIALTQVALVIVAYFLIDCVYSVFVKNNKINQWLLHNYLEPPMILFGFLVRSKIRMGVTRVREIV